MTTRTFTLTSPRPYESIPPSGVVGTIPIAGVFTWGPEAHAIEARFAGGPWTTIVARSTGSFRATLDTQPIGIGTLDVRLVDLPSVAITIPGVAIGDISALIASGRYDFHTRFNSALFDLMLLDGVTIPSALPPGTADFHVPAHADLFDFLLLDGAAAP